MAKKINVVELFARRTEIKAQIKLLEEEDQALIAQLKAAIPDNGSKDGIKHTVSTRSSTGYREYADFLVDKFVAANRKQTAAAMISEFTKTTEIHTFKAE